MLFSGGIRLFFWKIQVFLRKIQISAKNMEKWLTDGEDGGSIQKIASLDRGAVDISSCHKGEAPVTGKGDTAEVGTVLPCAVLLGWRRRSAGLSQRFL